MRIHRLSPTLLGVSLSVNSNSSERKVVPRKRRTSRSGPPILLVSICGAHLVVVSSCVRECFDNCRSFSVCILTRARPGPGLTRRTPKLCQTRTFIPSKKIMELGVQMAIDILSTIGRYSIDFRQRTALSMNSKQNLSFIKIPLNLFGSFVLVFCECCCWRALTSKYRLLP